jgi:hypothetical protein
MLDYYSNFPPPSRENAIEEVIKECKTKHTIPSNVDEKVLRDTATKVVTEMPSLGSYTGWYVGFRGDAIKMVLDKLNNLLP